jgi:hypothetical protein
MFAIFIYYFIGHAQSQLSLCYTCNWVFFSFVNSLIAMLNISFIVLVKRGIAILLLITTGSSPWFALTGSSPWFAGRF